jgi:hypothetical protein
LPTKGELVTWARNHDCRAKAALIQLFAKLETDDDTVLSENSKLLAELMSGCMAVGRIQADLESGRYR